MNKPVILDNGTGFIKVGYAGNNIPTHIIQSIVGKPILRVEEKANDNQVILKDIMCGDEAAKHRKYLEIEHPMENGIVRNWDNMDYLLDYTLNQLMSSSSRNKILFTEPPSNPFENRKKLYVFSSIHSNEYNYN